MASEREKILTDGLALTTGDRNKSYGDPSVNLSLQMRLCSTASLRLLTSRLARGVTAIITWTWQCIQRLRMKATARKTRRRR